MFFFFKQKTAYEMRISDWSSDVCSSDLLSVMTYNVAGLPWPLAKKGPEALHAIGERLSLMRARGCAPGVVVLQEAFSRDAKAIGRIAGYPYEIGRASGRERVCPYV